MIWVIFAVLTAGVILLVTRSLGRAGAAEGAAASEIEVYKQQLAELDRDEERGVLGQEEGGQTRAEISRRLLRASRQVRQTDATEKSGGVPATFAFTAVAMVIALGTLGLYAYYGKPGLPDQPLEARLSVPLQEQTLDIQVANVERRLRQNPRDAAGWAAIAPVYFKSAQFDKAAEAFEKSIELSGADEEKLLGLAESLTFANNGVIPDQAIAVLKEALKLNPRSLRARFWSGLLAEQDGKRDEAEHIYREMLSENIHPALRNIVTERLEGLTAAANNAPASEGKTASSENQAAGDSEQSDQAKMIHAMVGRLAQRLKTNKSDLEGWLRLIRSYAVLKETDKAQDAAATARQQFAANGTALDEIGALTKELGLAPDGGKPWAFEDNGAPLQEQASGGMLQGDQGKMIRGMVDRLAERLKENKSDLEGWLRLIRSYAVLKETDKAQDAAATARQQFAADANALEQIDALTKELSLATPDLREGQPKT